MLGVTIFVEKEPDFALDRVIVGIRQEYQLEFEEETYTIEDFEWGNIESITYGNWYDNAPEPHGYMTIYLKEHGKKKVLDAIEHLKTLGFVRNAYVESLIYPF
jgi:hypothetical protein